MKRSCTKEVSSKIFKFRMADGEHAFLAKGDKNYLDLLEGILEGDKKKAKRAIKDRANVNERTELGWSPLDLAVRQKNPEIIKMLAKNKANLTEYQGSPYFHPLFFALSINNKEAAKTFLKLLPEIEKQSWFKRVEDNDYLDRIRELRAEIDSEGPLSRFKKGNDKEPESTELDRLLYRLKHYGIIFVAGVLPAVVYNCLSFEGSWVNIAITTVFCVATTFLSSFREVNLSCYTSGDLWQGIALFWDEGIEYTITNIYKAPRYNPLAYIDYSYEYEGATVVPSRE